MGKTAEKSDHESRYRITPFGMMTMIMMMMMIMMTIAMMRRPRV